MQNKIVICFKANESQKSYENFFSCHKIKIMPSPKFSSCYFTNKLTNFFKYFKIKDNVMKMKIV